MAYAHKHAAATLSKNFKVEQHSVSWLYSALIPARLTGFSNTPTLSPPWTHVVRELIPLSSCDEAAKYLIKCLGGEDKAREVVGGVKWWQVRGIEGCVVGPTSFNFDRDTQLYFVSVDAQWITAKKDWREAKKRHKMHQSQVPNSGPDGPVQPPNGNISDTYEKHMDEMRCILYIHGGKHAKSVHINPG